MFCYFLKLFCILENAWCCLCLSSEDIHLSKEKINPQTTPIKVQCAIKLICGSIQSFWLKLSFKHFTFMNYFPFKFAIYLEEETRWAMLCYAELCRSCSFNLRLQQALTAIIGQKFLCLDIWHSQELILMVWVALFYLQYQYVSLNGYGCTYNND